MVVEEIEKIFLEVLYLRNYMLHLTKVISLF